MAIQNTPVSVPSAVEVRPYQELWRLVTGCLISQAIHVAAKLDIAGLLKDGPKSSTELAQATATHAPSLYRLLRALASIGVFAEDEQARFELTPLAELLQKDVPGSLHAGALFIGSVFQWPPLGELIYSIQTGEPSFNHLFGMDIWEYNNHHPEAHDLFHYAMSSFSAVEINAILSAYDFSTARTIIDVAGGHGTLLAAILNAYPNIQGILFDLPQVIQQAEPVLKAAGVEQRCTITAGDMFTSIPAEGDIYMMKTVLHDWDDDHSVAILQVCQAAMPAHAKLLLMTRVVAPGNTPDFSKFMDLNMLISMEGKERTSAEFEALLDAAGLTLSRIIPTRSTLSIIECIKC